MKFSVTPKMNRRKLGLRGLQYSLIITALIVFTVTKLYSEHLPIPKLHFSADTLPEMLVSEEGKPAREADSQIQTQPMKPICHFSTSDYCNMSGDVRVHGKSSTVFLSLTNETVRNSSYTIWPYTLKENGRPLPTVREYTVKIISSALGLKQLVPRCTRAHGVAGIVFSISGYTGNMFHDFSDVIVPLYLTTKEFNGEVEFLVTNKQAWWLSKYGALLKKLTNYNITDIDAENGVHCFPELLINLKRHKTFSIDPSVSPHYSMVDFRRFLREVYSLERKAVIQLRDRDDARRPRLMIITRKRNRVLINKSEIVKSARTLGFEVVATEGSQYLAEFSRLVHSCDVMLGVHGAGLTNMLFLPEKAVVIQIVPFGELEWFTGNYFRNPAKDMDLRYLEYKIGLEESSLKRDFPPDHPVLKDPNSIHKQGWLAVRAVYMRKQNITLDVAKFSATLLKAKKLLHP